MPKLPRDLQPQRLIRFLLKRGWFVAREGARHTVLVKGDLEIAVPRHAKLKIGTTAAILKQTATPPQEWDEL